DLFAIQSEIAQRVAERLNAKITSAEKLAIERKPTADLTAFDLYTRGSNLLLTAPFSGNPGAAWLQAIDLLNQAVARDPSFFQACQGRWEECIRNFERAIELDPRNVITLFQTGLSYGAVRRYAEQKSKFDRALTIDPNNLPVKAERAVVEVNWKADTGPLHQL